MDFKNIIGVSKTVDYLSEQKNSGKHCYILPEIKSVIKILLTTVSKNTLSLITLLIHTTDTVALFTALQFAELEVVLKNK